MENAFVGGQGASRERGSNVLSVSGAGDQAFYNDLVNRRVFLYNSDGSNPDANCLAIDLLTRGLLQYPNSPTLLRARADAFLSRRWKGDASFALFDIEKALEKAPNDPDLRICQIMALHTLGQDEGAHFLINQLLLKHPKLHTAEAGTGMFSKLRTEVLKAVQKWEDAAKVETDDDGEERSEESGYSSEDEDEDWNRSSTTYFAEEDDAEILKNIQTNDFSNLWAKQECHRLYQRYIGMCNNQTDTKEVTFLGKDDGIIASGSDDGMVYLFDAHSGQLLQVLQADSDIVNCVLAHPNQTVLATSGLEDVVKIFEPGQAVKSSNYSPSGYSLDDRVPESSYFPSPFSQRVNTNQEINNENFVRPLFRGAIEHMFGVGDSRAIFRALAQRFGTQMQGEGNPDGTVSCPVV